MLCSCTGTCKSLPRLALGNMKSNRSTLQKHAVSTTLKVKEYHFISLLVCLCVCGDVAAQLQCSPGSFTKAPTLPPNIAERSADNTTEYWFFDTAVTWCAAESSCVEHGGQLASLLTTAENNQVLNTCFNKLLSSDPTGGCWIGLHDMEAEGQYQWTDRSPFYFEDWFRGPTFSQPDDAAQEDDEDCVFAFKAYGGWHDRACNASYAYVCKVRSNHTLEAGAANSVVESPPLVEVLQSPVVSETPNPRPSPLPATNNSASDDHSERWKTVVVILVPVLVGISAIVTICYTGWKWWHKRGATLARRDAAAHVPHGGKWSYLTGTKPVKPLTPVVTDV